MDEYRKRRERLRKFRVVIRAWYAEFCRTHRYPKRSLVEIGVTEFGLSREDAEEELARMLLARSWLFQHAA